MIKTYSELIELPTFKERYLYLKLNGSVAEETFGWDRHINQNFYRSKEWKNFRRDMIIRDEGCDLACSGYEILDKILLHHINPLTKEDILYKRFDVILNPENVICVSIKTHNAIHYGDESQLYSEIITRSKNDTCPWKGGKY